ncbi:hypothetical protein R1sor_019503 [Riccia sorocarpa]|uniref:Uncharacterized protein n=1 Tax=Riccia sorocarpa TaxID=122646 RepID=A0ABD3IDB5_9MARC
MKVEPEEERSTGGSVRSGTTPEETTTAARARGMMMMTLASYAGEKGEEEIDCPTRRERQTTHADGSDEGGKREPALPHCLAAASLLLLLLLRWASECAEEENGQWSKRHYTPPLEEVERRPQGEGIPSKKFPGDFESYNHHYTIKRLPLDSGVPPTSPSLSSLAVI